MHVPTHAQQTCELTAEERSQSQRRADLCRNNPATFSALVRRSDWYERQGWETVAALRQAMADYDV